MLFIDFSSAFNTITSSKLNATRGDLRSWWNSDWDKIHEGHEVCCDLWTFTSFPPQTHQFEFKSMTRCHAELFLLHWASQSIDSPFSFSILQLCWPFLISTHHSGYVNYLPSRLWIISERLKKSKTMFYHNASDLLYYCERKILYLELD